MLKEKFTQPSKCIEILWSCLSQNFDSPCMFSITLILKNSHIFWNLPTLTFYRKDLKPTWQILNSKFESQCKDWKSRYQERKIFAFVFKLVPLILVQKFLEGLRVMQTPKTNQVWGKLKTSNCFQKQLFRRYWRRI